MIANRRWEMVLFDQISDDGHIDTRDLMDAYDRIMRSQGLYAMNLDEINGLLGKEKGVYKISYPEYLQSLLNYIVVRNHYKTNTDEPPPVSKKWIFEKDRDEALIVATIFDQVLATLLVWNTYDKFSFWITIARMSAVHILTNTAYILIMSSFDFKILPDRILAFKLPIDRYKYYHKCFGCKILLASLIHVLAHLFHIHNILRICVGGCSYAEAQVVPISDRQTIISYSYFARQYAYITGGVLSAAFIIMPLFIWIGYKRYVRLYVGRIIHISISVICMILIVAHGCSSLLGFNYSFIAVLPLLLKYIWHNRYYVIPSYAKINRSLVSKTFIRLYLADDPHLNDMLYNFNSVVVFVNHPDVNAFEWHPFTLSRGYRSTDAILSMERTGPWTNAIADHLLSSTSAIGRIRIGGYNRSIFRFHRLYPIRYFLCAGIGITVFIASMIDTLRSPFGSVDTILVWSVNSVELINQFNDQILNFQKLLPNIKVSVYYSNRNNEIPNDAITKSRFEYLQYTIFNKFGFDILTRSHSPMCSYLGRANFFDVMSSSYFDRRMKIGVFVCGGEGYVERVSDAVNYLNDRARCEMYKMWVE